MENSKETARKLLAKGYTRAETARLTGVSRQTISNWMKDEKFRQGIKTEEQELAKESLNKRLILDEELNDKQDKVQNLESNLGIDLLREKELKTLNRIESYAEEQAIEGNLKAIATILRISERRAKLLGLDRPTLPLLGAVEMLLSEGVLQRKQAEIVANGLQSMEDALRNSEND